MAYFKITYSNGYCGCDDDEFITADTLEEAEEVANEGVHDYGESYEHCAHGCSFAEGWENEDAENTYYENLAYEVVEMTREDWIEESGQEDDEDDEDDE